MFMWCDGIAVNNYFPRWLKVMSSWAKCQAGLAFRETYIFCMGKFTEWTIEIKYVCLFHMNALALKWHPVHLRITCVRLRPKRNDTSVLENSDACWLSETYWPTYAIGLWINSMQLSDVIWHARTLPASSCIVACFLTAPSHCLNQCWFIIRGIQRYSI